MARETGRNLRDRRSALLLILALSLACDAGSERGAAPADPQPPTAPRTADAERGEAPADPPPATGPRPADPGPTLSLDAHRRELAAIGYADFSASGSAGDGASGVVLHDPRRSVPGFNLVTSIPFGRAVLVDASGVERHVWSRTGSTWVRSHLLPDGDLLVIQLDAVDDQVRPAVVRYSWDGEPAWRLELPAHHDLDVLPDGRILVLTRRDRPRPGYAPGGQVRDNGLALVSPDGVLLEERSLTDMIDAGPAPFPWKPLRTLPERHDALAPADYLHVNSVVWIDGTPAAGSTDLFGPGRVLLSSRHQDRLLIVDWVRGGLVWASEPGRFQRQHEATPLRDGRVLLFDNGTAERGWSRIVEYDPADHAITWQYRADPPEAFFSEGRGTVQPLRGGHVLVGHSAAGEAFEVTRSGDVVWRYRNPDTRADGAHAALRIERLPVDRVRPLLADEPGR